MPPQGLWPSCRDATSSTTVTFQPPLLTPESSSVNVKRFCALRSAGRLASRLASAPHQLQQSMTLAFLENQLASALTLQSTQEYRYWLLIYTRFLVNEGDGPVLTTGPCVPTRLSASFSACAPGPEYHLRELCKELLGPVHKSATTSWEPTTLVGTNLRNKWSKCVCCFHLDWNSTCRVFNSSEKKSCQVHIFSSNGILENLRLHRRPITAYL